MGSKGDAQPSINKLTGSTQYNSADGVGKSRVFVGLNGLGEKTSWPFLVNTLPK